MSGKTILTASAGRPAADDQGSLTVGPRGPISHQDSQPIENRAHHNVDQVPARHVAVASSVDVLIEMQRQAFTGAQSLSRLWMASWLRLIDQQRQLFDHATRRIEDTGPVKSPPAKGADLQDHYGKRSRDVDVERI